MEWRFGDDVVRVPLTPPTRFSLIGGETPMPYWRKYRRTQIMELRPYVPGELLTGVSISKPDKDAGSPKPGDMIARNSKNYNDQWLVAKQYFEDNYDTKPMEES